MLGKNGVTSGGFFFDKWSTNVLEQGGGVALLGCCKQLCYQVIFSDAIFSQ